MDTPQGDKTQAITDQAFRVKAEIDLDEFYTRLATEAQRLLNDYQQQGLAGAELADKVAAGLQDLSDVPVQKAGRASTSEAFNLGRNLAAQTNAPAIGQVVRTEILDDATCGPCLSLDGAAVTFNSPEYFQLMPPNLCEGRELCRGFYIYRSA